MNYCEKIRYRICMAEKAAFPVMIDSLLAQLPGDEFILRLAFFGTPPSNEEYLKRHALLKEKTAARFGNREPALSYVSQPPLNAPLLVEIHSIVSDEMDKITYKQFQKRPYALLENAEGRFLFAGGFQGDISASVEQQSAEVFRQVEELLRLEHFPVHSIIRQWNYIEQISCFSNGNQHYQSFNNARSDFYERMRGLRVIRRLRGLGLIWGAYWSTWMQPCLPLPAPLPQRLIIRCKPQPTPIRKKCWKQPAPKRKRRNLNALKASHPAIGDWFIYPAQPLSGEKKA